MRSGRTEHPARGREGQRDRQLRPPGGRDQPDVPQRPDLPGTRDRDAPDAFQDWEQSGFLPWKNSATKMNWMRLVF